MASFKRVRKDKLIYGSVQGAKSLNLINGIKVHKSINLKNVLLQNYYTYNLKKALISESSGFREF
jgi:hypothetical protein